MENFKTQLDINFSREIKTHLIEALHRAYETAIDAYDESTGSNANTFGMGLYWFCVHELSLLAQDETNDIELIRERPDFRLKIGSIIVACHNVGSAHEQDISVSFPNNNRAAGQLALSNAEQLSLPGFESNHFYKENTSNELKVVLAHIGNPLDGMGAVYLCVPVYEKKGRIKLWGYTDLLWKTDDGENFATSTNKNLPEEMPIEPAIVRLKPGKKKKEANGGDI